MTSCGCGCCSGVQVITPASTYNAPGLPTLARRVGTHGRFLETMRRRLSSQPALAALTARTTDDFSIALLDAWAIVADVLTFYQERVANEGYLRTATEAFSVFELGRLVGYEPRPALGASCYLAYTLDPGTSTLIPAGSQVKNVSSDGSAPQTFETSEDLIARDEWSALVPRRTALALAGGVSDATRLDALTLAGAAVNVQPSDRLLMFFGPDQTVPRVVAGVRADFTAGVTAVQLVPPPDAPDPVTLARDALTSTVAEALDRAPDSVTTQPFFALLTTWRDGSAENTAAELADQTRQLAEQIALARPHLPADLRSWLDQNLGSVLAAAEALAAALVRRDRVVAPAVDEATRAAALALCGGSSSSGTSGSDLGIVGRGTKGQGDCDRGAALAGLTPMLAALRKPPSQPPANARALTTTAALDFAPDSDAGAKLLAAADPRLAGVLYEAWNRAEIAPPVAVSDVQVMRVKARSFGTTANPRIEHRPADGATPVTLRLDAVYEGMLAGSWVVIEGDAGDGTVNQIVSVSTSSSTVATLTVRTTVLTLASSLPNSTNGWMVWGAGESVQPLGDPITDPVAGAEIELDRVYDGLTTGRWLIVAGERTDVPFTSGVPGVELTMIAGVRQRVDPNLPGDTVRTTLELVSPLAYAYRRDTVTLYGNVVAATQGETRNEVLGSGDASIAGQTFTLRQVDAQHPLTALPADNPVGFERSDTVRVNGVAWHEVDVLALAGPTEHDYSVQTPVGSASVSFGDGTNGARLPTGVENVVARYRVGAGPEGNIEAGRLTELASRPLGVSGVTNPIPATGGSRGDGPDDARAVTPARMLALDRLVSDVDYENFTRARAGIGKASARRLSDGNRQVVHVTIAGIDDAPIDPSSVLVGALGSSLADFGDPPLPVVIGERDLIRLVLAAGVHVQADYSWDLVEPAVRAAVLDALGFARRQLGEPAFLSTAIAAMQAVPGVDYIDVDVFGGVSANATPLQLITLAGRLGSAAACVPARLAEWQVEVVTAAADDTLSSVATGHGLTLDELIELNPHLPSIDVAGQRLVVARGFVPAQLAVLTDDVPETLRLRRIP